MANAFQHQPEHSADAERVRREAEQAAAKRAEEQRLRSQEEARRRKEEAERLAAQAAARHAAAIRAETERRQQDEKERARQSLIRRQKDELLCTLEASLKGMGYIPPDPSPLLQVRAVEQLRQHVRQEPSDETLRQALSLVERDLQTRFDASVAFARQLQDAVTSRSSIVDRFKMFMARVDGAIDSATLSLEPPTVAPTMRATMERTERFLAEPWAAERGRGVLAIHVDEESRQTVVQIGLAEHGVVYITIPRVLKPQEIAHSSLGELIGRLKLFTGNVDPLAVINGAYPRINFTYLFEKSRVIRAPSGDVDRLSANLDHVSRRGRLTPENTVIINSAPATASEYASVFPDNTRGWATWSHEAAEWQTAASNSGFTPATQASRDTFLAALVQSQNVIVMVAHCNGHDLFLPHPAPAGTRVSAEDLYQHRAAIAANRPFVYLFACKAGDLENVDNFASTLLNAGASGVVAAQTTLVAAEGQDLLARILNDRRGAPPIEDLWEAIHDTGYLEMEVFLA